MQVSYAVHLQKAYGLAEHLKKAEDSFYAVAECRHVYCYDICFM